MVDRLHQIKQALTTSTSYIRPSINIQHSSMYHFRKWLYLFNSLCFSAGLHAQVFLPDQLLRDALNEQVPGLVDADGILNLSDPGLGEVTGLMLEYLPDVTYVDLAGLDAIHGLLGVFIDATNENTTTISIPAFPDQLQGLSIFASEGTITLGAMPSSMNNLVFRASNQQAVYVSIASLPDTLENMTLDGTLYPTIGSTSTYFTELIVTDINVPWLPPQDFSWLTGSTCEELKFTGCSIASLDLGNTSCDYLRMTESSIGQVILPPDIRTLYVGNYLLNEIASFPNDLESINITLYYGASVCLPMLPDGVQYLRLDSSAHCLPNWPQALASVMIDGLVFGPDDVNYCSVLNSDCPGSYPGIAGKAFIDENANGQFDPGEPGLTQAPIMLQPSDHSTEVNTQGDWELGVPPGNYVISVASTYPYIQSITPAQHTAEVPSMGDTDTDNDFAVVLIPGINDLRAFITSDVTRPGFDNRLYLTCNNYGTVPLDASLTLDFDTDQSWVGSSIAPSSQTGNTATWDLGTLPVGTTTNITVDLYTAPSVPLGTPIQHTLTANPVAGDETPADNIVIWVDSVIGSYDPNDKLIAPAALTLPQVTAGETPIDYTIRFQNTGTYLAERVVILDTLPEGLVLESIQFLAGSHTSHWYVTDGVLHVIHNDIMLPDSTSDEPNSHGYVKFRIMPSTDLIEGQQLFNIAHIVFDFNEPIITPPAVFTVHSPTSVNDHTAIASRVFPNPVRDRLWITGTTGTTAVRIRDVQGRSVQQGTIIRDRSTDVGTLAPGVYVIELLEQDGLRAVRFVKE